MPLTQEKVESTYADVFQGLGKFPGEPYKLRLKPDAVPAKHRPRKVPVHLQEAFHEEVERLVKIDVLEPVTEPTEWVNSFVVVEKVIDSSNAHSPHHIIKKSIQLCIDPKDLNEALEREPYYSRSIDELISMFAGAKVFTIVDMDKGYWQVVLHPDSRKYTCMAFDIGRYQFKRLPMGSKVASDIFQRMLDSVYIGLPGVTGIADDMVIFGRDEEEHDRNLILFLEATRRNGLILNKRKLQFKKEEVSFFGHRWNSTGISPDPKKTESILRMEFPPDKETMHSFLGLVNFLNRYTPRLAELCSPLRKLILKDSHYSPGDPEHAAFSAIKAEFKKKIILPYFDRNKETILQTDASKKGFGAVILQEEQPIYYASRALTSAEKNYQNYHSAPSTEAVFCHSNPLTEAPLNFAGSSHATDQLETQNSSSIGSNKPSLSITDLPLTQEKVESTYADVFQGLGKFPDEPYKLRLKPDAVPARHRPRKYLYICKKHSMRRLNDW